MSYRDDAASKAQWIEYVIDSDHSDALVFEPVAVTLLHDLTFARVYALSIGADEERVTLAWEPDDAGAEWELAERADAFARERLGALLRAHALSAYEFLGMGRIAFAHACDALTFDVLCGGRVSPCSRLARRG